MGVDIPIDRLGNFPIVQFAAALVIVGFGAIMMWRAFISKAPAPSAAVPEQRWYFEGPIAEMFKQLARVNQHLDRAVEHLEKANELADKKIELLTEIERHLRDQPRRR